MGLAALVAWLAGALVTALMYVVLALVLLLVWVWLTLPKQTLKGPPRHWLLGNVLDIAKCKNELHVAMNKWRLEYGDIYQIWLFNRLFTVTFKVRMIACNSMFVVVALFILVFAQDEHISKVMNTPRGYGISII